MPSGVVVIADHRGRARAGRVRRVPVPEVHDDIGGVNAKRHGRACPLGLHVGDGLIDDRQASCLPCGLVDRVEGVDGPPEVEEADQDEHEYREDQRELHERLTAVISTANHHALTRTVIDSGSDPIEFVTVSRTWYSVFPPPGASVND